MKASTRSESSAGPIIDLIKPIQFQDMLRLRRWCSATSTRWREKRIRIDGRKGGLIESEAFWININPDTLMPSRISDEFLEGLHATTNIHRLKWTPYLKPGNRKHATQTRYYSVRFTDIDLFNLQHVDVTAFAAAVLQESSHHKEFERSHPLSMP